MLMPDGSYTRPASRGATSAAIDAQSMLLEAGE
jgi:hypothetical protein